jgi:segregation and condensation protein B
MERENLISLLEAILFVASQPVSRKSLFAFFQDASEEEVEAALEEVLGRYQGGVLAEEVAGGVRLATRPEHHEDLKRYFDLSGPSRLTPAALETLAIVAYRQPITAPEIQELRGRHPGAVLKTLLDRRMIRIAGRKMVVGKPFLYCTTREFLVHFGLEELTDLPPLEDLEEVFEEGLDEENGGLSTLRILEASQKNGASLIEGGDE